MEITHNVTPATPAPTLAEEAAALDVAAAEAAKKAAEAAPAPVVAKDPERPAWLPEEFKSAEEMAAAYAALKPTKPADGEVKPETAPPADAPKPGTPEAAAAAAEAVAKAGVDVSTFQTEYAKTGDVSEESRAKLADSLKGQFGENARMMIDSYIEGQKAVATNLQNAALNEVGGKDAYTAIAQWARTGMPKAELEAFNKAVGSGDMNTTLLAMRGMKASYEKANGRAPSLVKGENGMPSAGESGPFASTKQMVDAINDPRYAKDSAYRNAVMKRVQAG